MLKKEGWYIHRVKGSHHHFKHSTRKGLITVPHPEKDLPQGTLRQILKQAGITL
jgi:predicted RNA binding protein YcfA (HicA-like mRNA interferase family)